MIINFKNIKIFLLIIIEIRHKDSNNLVSHTSNSLVLNNRKCNTKAVKIYKDRCYSENMYAVLTEGICEVRVRFFYELFEYINFRTSFLTIYCRPTGIILRH